MSRIEQEGQFFLKPNLRGHHLVIDMDNEVIKFGENSEPFSALGGMILLEIAVSHRNATQNYELLIKGINENHGRISDWDYKELLRNVDQIKESGNNLTKRLRAKHKFVVKHVSVVSMREAPILVESD